ncbi:hypothetical protein MMC13_004151 [Lambiella insularis]|nr:hypothetical protein [Lambiella insularis]
MSGAFKNVIVVGAGGNLGAPILSALDSNKHFTVSVLARQASKSTFPSHVKVHSVGNDYPEAELLEAFKGQDAVVSAITSYGPGVSQQKKLIDAAVKAGVKRFVPSEFGSNTLDKNARALLPQLFGAKLEIVEYLRGKEKEGLTWSAFVTGPFFDWGLAVGFLGYNLKERKATIYDDGNTVWSTTTLATIGKAVSNAMLVPEKTANKYLFIDSFTVSQNEVLESLERVTNEKWDVKHVDAEGQKKEGLDKFSKGDFSGVMQLLCYGIFVNGHGNNYTKQEGGANELLSLPKQTLDEVITEVVKG